MSSVRHRGYPVELGARVLLLFGGLLLAGGLVLAFNLEPDPRLFGTHQKLGLPPCSFRTQFGLPCPTCGMTTSVACCARGRFLDASRANPAGIVAVFACAALIPWCWWSALRGRLSYIPEPLPTVVGAMLAFCGLLLINWLWRILLHFIA